MLVTSIRGWKPSASRKLAISFLFIFWGALLTFAPASNAADAGSKHAGHLSQNYTLNIDPGMSDKAGKEMFEEVMNFFNEAEAAIEAKDLDKLMALYSEGYTNGVHKKVDISLAWKRLFKDFGGLAMTHNMHLSMHDAKTNVAVMTCSGILVGVPTGDKESIALDYWMNNDHVLVKEGGKWKILGSIGAEKKRLWFDKPLHPLF